MLESNRKQDLRKESARTKIVAAVDAALVSEQPATRAVPKSYAAGSPGGSST